MKLFLKVLLEIIPVSSKGPPTVIKGTDRIVSAAVQHHCIENLPEFALIAGKVASLHVWLK